MTPAKVFRPGLPNSKTSHCAAKPAPPPRRRWRGRFTTMAGRNLPMAQTSSLPIREARLDDVPGVKAIHKAAVWQLCANDYTPEQLAAWTESDDTPALPIALRPGSDSIMWVAEQDGAVVGFGSLGGDEVHAVYVHPEHARQGIGTRL